MGHETYELSRPLPYVRPQVTLTPLTSPPSPLPCSLPTYLPTSFLPTFLQSFPPSLLPFFLPSSLPFTSPSESSCTLIHPPAPSLFFSLLHPFPSISISSLFSNIFYSDFQYKFSHSFFPFRAYVFFQYVQDQIVP